MGTHTCSCSPYSRHSCCCIRCHCRCIATKSLNRRLCAQPTLHVQNCMQGDAEGEWQPALSHTHNTHNTVHSVTTTRRQAYEHTRIRASDCYQPPDCICISMIVSTDNSKRVADDACSSLRDLRGLCSLSAMIEGARRDGSHSR
jgi:hypothetical protein